MRSQAGVITPILAAAIIAVSTLFAGCATGHISDYSLVSPVASRKPVFEDSDVRLAIRVVDDSRYSLELANKTGAPLMIAWAGSTLRSADGGNEELAYKLGNGGKDVTESHLETTVAPGGVVVVEVYPAANVYVDEQGVGRVYPLYCKGSPVGDPRSLDGREIGVNLVVIIDDHARSYPLMLKVKM
ncbi:MAG: hypothetical protein HZC51_03030 [Nitrospirae bacterium]|nr:hypothetical protein [Nitrospirota bacterium]